MIIKLALIFPKKKDELQELNKKDIYSIQLSKRVDKPIDIINRSSIF